MAISKSKIKRHGDKLIEFHDLVGKKANLVSLRAATQVFNVELVECFRNNVLLVSQPDFVSANVQMQVGEYFQIRFEINNIVFSYHTKIVRFCNNAQLCLQVIIPGTATQANLVREPRVKVEKKEIKIVLQDGKQKIPVSVADVSVNGACLVADSRLGNINEEFNIELTIKESASSIRLPCKIRYVRTEIDSTTQPEKNRFLHGVEFLHLANNAENFLLRFVS